jgi:hypothetical protein
MDHNLAELLMTVMTIDRSDRCIVEQLLASPWLAKKIQPALSQGSVMGLVL